MQLRKAFRGLSLFFALALVFSGCSEKKSSQLDQQDIRFAGFYSDYLLLSGVTATEGGVTFASLESAELQELLLRHTLTREQLNLKVELYKDNPELWQKVLLQVRQNIRKKSIQGQ